MPDVRSLRVVVDASIVGAALVRPGGWTSLELERIDMRLHSPDFLLRELEEHAYDYASFAGVSPGTMRRRISSLERITLVPEAQLHRFLDDPRVVQARSLDPDDWPYLAAVAAVEAEFLWTRDRKLLEAFVPLALSMIPRVDDEVSHDEE